MSGKRIFAKSFLQAASFSAFSNDACARLARSSVRRVAPSDFPCRTPGGPLFLPAGRPGPGPVVLKSGRNRRYRPVARPVIVGRAVTNRVSGPRPSGHFPAPTSGPRRFHRLSSSSRWVAEWPSRPREGSLSPASPSTQVLRRSPSRKPGSLERLPLRGAHSQPPSMPRCPCILGPPRRSLSRRVRAEGLRVASLPLLPLFSPRAEARDEKSEKRNEKAKIAGGRRRGGERRG